MTSSAISDRDHHPDRRLIVGRVCLPDRSFRLRRGQEPHANREPADDQPDGRGGSAQPTTSVGKPTGSGAGAGSGKGTSTGTPTGTPTGSGTTSSTPTGTGTSQATGAPAGTTTTPLGF